MTKKLILLCFILCNFSISLFAQTSQEIQEIDLMLLKGEFQKAINKCNLLEKKHFKNSLLLTKKGLAYQAIMNNKKAMEIFEKALKLSPKDNKIKVALGKCYIKTGRIPKAQNIFAEVVSSDKDNFEGLQYLAKIYLKRRWYKEALKIYKKLSNHQSDNPHFYSRIAYCYEKKQKLVEACIFYLKAYQLDSCNVSAIVDLSELYTKTAQPLKAIRILGRAIDLEKNNSNLYRRRGYVNFCKNYYFRSAKDYENTLRLGDSNFVVLHYGGYSNYKIKKYEKANELLIKAYKKDTTDLDVVTSLCLVNLKLENTKMAAYYGEQFRTLTFGDPSKLANAYGLLAKIHKLNNEYEKQIYCYQEQKKMDFKKNYLTYPFVDYHTAIVYDQKLANREKAIVYYEKFLKRTKDFSFRKEYKTYAKARIKQLKIDRHFEAPAKDTL